MWFSSTVQGTSCVQDTGLSPHQWGLDAVKRGRDRRLIKPRMLSAKWTVGTPSSLVTGEGDACCSPDLMTSTQCRQECPPPTPPVLTSNPCTALEALLSFTLSLPPAQPHLPGRI